MAILARARVCLAIFFSPSLTALRRDFLFRKIKETKCGYLTIFPYYTHHKIHVEFELVSLQAQNCVSLREKQWTVLNLRIRYCYCWNESMERSDQNTASMLWRNSCIAGKKVYRLLKTPFAQMDHSCREEKKRTRYKDRDQRERN